MFHFLQSRSPSDDLCSLSYSLYLGLEHFTTVQNPDTLYVFTDGGYQPHERTGTIGVVFAANDEVLDSYAAKYSRVHSSFRAEALGMWKGAELAVQTERDEHIAIEFTSDNLRLICFLCHVFLYPSRPIDPILYEILTNLRALRIQGYSVSLRWVRLRLETTSMLLPTWQRRLPSDSPSPTDSRKCLSVGQVSST
eukprot:TRINITY_DN4370_c1_g1_i1.p1 TRINITY_DN4370_c1_g1~~TRINITY_DN4370_c1_g1_i1.p1  ORF type:complete len:195 (+),score=4.60 TRINITY_DN4370_c1_g1_i1:415-999(+)